MTLSSRCHEAVARDELCSIIGCKGHVAIYCSDQRLKAVIARALLDPEDVRFGRIEPTPAARLSASLIAEREARTLWLSGTHRRTTSKADNKVLSGLDLRYALDPLGDQSYFFTAARSTCELPGEDPRTTIGVAPRKSSVWLSTARSWQEHRDTAAAILTAIQAPDDRTEPPLPVLATSAPAGVTLADLGQPYDAAFIPPELLEDIHAAENRELLERLARYVLSAIVRDEKLVLTGSGADAAIEVTLDVDLRDAGTMRWQVDSVHTPEPADDATSAMADDVRHAINRYPGWLKIWFESGYTLADRSLFLIRHRDVPFTGWHWANFDGYDVTKEKPDPLAAENIGQDDSLFCWVANQVTFPWAASRGWLASNDGSMEIADFIHVDDANRVLTLVHVKGANSGSKGRRVSVSAYEIVVGQAVKNLRHVDQELLSGGFLDALDRRLQAAVWRDGEFLGSRGRDPMKRAIQDLGSGYARQVVVVQPHVREQSLARARTSAGSQALVAKHLDTLLLGARASCLAVGAEFMVVGAAI